MFRRLVACLFSLALCRSAAAGELGTQLAAAAGSGMLFLVTLPDPEGLLLKGDILGAPVSFDFSRLVESVAPALLVSRQLSQIDLALKPVRIVGLRHPATGGVRLAYCLSALDPAAYVASLGTPVATEGSVTRYRTRAADVFVAVRGQEVLVSQDAVLAARLLDLPPVAEPLSPVQRDVQIDVPVAHVLRLYERELGLARALALGSPEGLVLPGWPGKLEGRTAAELLDLAREAGLQLQGVRLMLRLRGRELLVRASLRALPDSAFARFLQAQGPGSEALLAGLPEPALSAGGAELRPTPELIEFFAAIWSAAAKVEADSTSSAAGPGRAALRPVVASRLSGIGPRLAVTQVRATSGGPSPVMTALIYDRQEPAPSARPLAEPVETIWFGRPFGVRAEWRRLPVDDPRLPAGSETTELRIGWAPPAASGPPRPSLSFPEVETWVPLGPRLLRTSGPDSRSLAVVVLGWLQRPDWQRPDTERHPGVTLLSGPRHLWGFVQVAQLVERQFRRGTQPVSEPLASFLSVLGHGADRLWIEARAVGLELQLGGRLQLEGTLRAIRASQKRATAPRR